MRFEPPEAARDDALAHRIVHGPASPGPRQPINLPGGYGDNFATNRRSVWTD